MDPDTERSHNSATRLARDEVFTQKVLKKLVGTLPQVSEHKKINEQSPLLPEEEAHQESSIAVQPAATENFPIALTGIACHDSKTYLETDELEGASMSTPKLNTKFYGPTKTEFSAQNHKKQKTEPQTVKNRKRKLKKKRRNVNAGNVKSVPFTYVPQS